MARKSGQGSSWGNWAYGDIGDRVHFRHAREGRARVSAWLDWRKRRKERAHYIIESDLEPGDIVLTWEKRAWWDVGGIFRQHIIRFGQKSPEMHSAHARYTHVGLYVPDGYFLDRVNENESWNIRRIDDVADRGYITVLRPNFEVTERERTKLLAACIAMLRNNYDKDVVWRMIYEWLAVRIPESGLRQYLLRLSRKRRGNHDVCSEFISTAYLLATEKDVIPEEPQVAVTPARISASGLLSPVPLRVQTNPDREPHVVWDARDGACAFIGSKEGVRWLLGHLMDAYRPARLKL